MTSIRTMAGELKLSRSGSLTSADTDLAAEREGRRARYERVRAAFWQYLESPVSSVNLALMRYHDALEVEGLSREEFLLRAAVELFDDRRAANQALADRALALERSAQRIASLEYRIDTLLEIVRGLAEPSTGDDMRLRLIALSDRIAADRTAEKGGAR